MNPLDALSKPAVQALAVVVQLGHALTRALREFRRALNEGRRNAKGKRNV